MVFVSLDSPSCEVPCLILLSVVYRDVTRQAKVLYRLKHEVALKRGLAYLSRCNSGWFCHSDDRRGFARAASAVKLQLKPATTTPAPKSSTREESTSAGPVTAAPAPKLSAPVGSTPMEPAPEADTMLPDLLPPELQQGEAGAGGEEQVEAPDAARTDGTGKHLTAHG
jgi:hypothetical protein